MKGIRERGGKKSTMYSTVLKLLYNLTLVLIKQDPNASYKPDVPLSSVKYSVQQNQGYGRAVPASLPRMATLHIASVQLGS